MFLSSRKILIIVFLIFQLDPCVASVLSLSIGQYTCMFLPHMRVQQASERERDIAGVYTCIENMRGQQ